MFLVALLFALTTLPVAATAQSLPAPVDEVNQTVHELLAPATGPVNDLSGPLVGSALGTVSTTLAGLNPIIDKNDMRCPSHNSCNFEFTFTHRNQNLHNEYVWICSTYYVPRGVVHSPEFMYAESFNNGGPCPHLARMFDVYSPPPFFVETVAAVMYDYRVQPVRIGSGANGNIYRVSWTDWHSEFSCKPDWHLELREHLAGNPPLSSGDVIHANTLMGKPVQPSPDCVGAE